MHLCTSITVKKEMHPTSYEIIDKSSWVHRQKIDKCFYKKYPFKARVLIWVLKHAGDSLCKLDIS